MVRVDGLITPALVLEADAFDHNLRTMAAALPGKKLRPHVKAHKTTALAARQAAAGHHSLTCATIREVEGMAAAGLNEDMLLANEVLEAPSLGRVVASVGDAVESATTLPAAGNSGGRPVPGPSPGSLSSW